MPDSQIQMFFDMLLECYGICGWKLTPELEVEYTNSQMPNLHKAQLLGRGRREIILEQAARSDVPMVVSDSMGLMWGVVEMKTGRPENVGDFYAIGPVLNKEPDIRMLETLLEPFNLTVEYKWAMIHNLSLMPYVGTVVFFQHILMLHYYVNGQKTRISDFVYYTPRQEKMARVGSAIREDMPKDVPHATPLTEKKLLDMVRTGNLEFQKALEDAGSVSPGIRVQTADPIRQAKYSVVAFITLCTRAAIEGGLSSEIAYTLSDTYVQSVDMARTVSHVAAVSHTMYEDFIRRVNQVRRTSGISKPVRICCDYIDTHPESEITLTLLAKRVGYAQTYLARKFKEEMGMPVNAYVRRARIHRAKMLLSETAMTVQEIADRLHFCSGSYFAEMFRKETGMTPGDFREPDKIKTENLPE